MRKNVIYCSIFYLILTLMLFQNIISFRLFDFVGYLDEIIAFIGLFLIFGSILLNGSIDKNIFKALIVFIMFLIVTFVSTLFYSLQPFNAELLDFISLVKFPLSFIGFYFLFSKYQIGLPNLEIYVKVVLIILFGYFILDFFFNFSDSKEYVLNGLLHSSYLGFSHETFMVATVIVLLSMCEIYVKKNKLFYILLCILFIAFSFKAKAYLFIAVYGYLKFFYNKRLSLKVLGLVICIAIAFVLVNDKFIFYWSGSGTYTARRAMFECGFIVANDHFPFGVGYGNFGSYVSADYYPQYYYIYGLSNVWGLTPDRVDFTSDHFWPIIIGESGYLGLILYSLMLYFMFKTIKKYSNRKTFIGCIIPFVYLFAASTAESSFVNNYSSLFGIIIVFNFCNYNFAFGGMYDENIVCNPWPI